MVRRRTLPAHVSASRIRRRFVAFATCCTLLLCYANPHQAEAAVTRTQIEQQRAHLHQTATELNAHRHALHDAQVRENDLQRQVAETETSIAATSARIGLLENDIAVNRRRLAWNEMQLAAAQRSLARHNAALQRRLVDAYENGELGYLQVLLASRSFSEFVERWDDIGFLIAANERTIRERRHLEKQVARMQATLENDAATLDDENAREQRTRTQLQALESQRQNLVAITDRIRQHHAVAVVELEESSQQQESQLESLIVERQREEAAALEAAREAARRAAQLAGTAISGEVPSGSPGDLSWPVSGPITSPFGMRLDPVSGAFTRMHTGIDIGAPEDATIVAAAAGRVILANWTDGGYGNLVVIDHGNGLSTLYAHCSKIYVSIGQDVQRGQAIAAVGATGHATGPHVHFEVRLGGQPVDPTSRLR